MWMQVSTSLIKLVPPVWLLGNLICSSACRLPHILDSSVLEASSMRSAVTLAISKKWDKVIFEADA
ncbi:conserved hypothetical protein [Ricinus communis]|uniref:RNase H type-1 domain-containing protein n=1 Tax=Ricinus communis TaxID=3988 RepID=B9SNJ2_RICCO|nr:conserved hypothetical protein [Ricinus communis]